MNAQDKALTAGRQDGSAQPSGNIPLPLTGVRVLDLGHVFQGPYATFLMAMAGAEVIKIEPPRGDMSRKRGRDGDYPFRALNGCKRGIVLNLKAERGRELLLQLARSADVLVENFAPAVMPRLGLAADVFMNANPRLIYASASGFGSTGPYADKLDIGQRKGLGVASPVPLYVLGKNAADNILVVGTQDELGSRELTARDVNWVNGEAPNEPFHAEVKTRYTAKEADALVVPIGENQAQVQFDAPQRDVTAGQAAVFFRGDLLVGGGIIL